MAELIEFKNHNNEILRGIFDEADSDAVVIFVHGFERTTIERKFKNIVDKLKGKINLFRFDFSGCGLSDGQFEDLTVEKLKNEIGVAISLLKNKIKGLKYVDLVSHSLGCCAALKFIKENPGAIYKSVFFGPAFNQRKLLRFYFTKNKMSKSGIEITYDNFRDYLNENEFKQDINIKKRLTKEHYLLNDYFLENNEFDYQDLFAGLNFDLNNFLIIQGDKDDKAPIESNDRIPKEIKIIKVENGDHDFQRPDMVEQYINELLVFLS